MKSTLNVFNTNSTSVIIKKFTGFESSFSVSSKEIDSEKYGLGAVLDVETTGTNVFIDEVIQLSFRLFYFDRTNPNNLKIGDAYQSYNQPSKSIPLKITRLTNITDDDVKGWKINWKEVFSILKDTEIVVAHNAAFDRSFIDRENKTAAKLNWACSVHQVDWQEKGFSSAKLEMLCVFSGFFGDFHSASGDVDLLLKLLTLSTPRKGTIFSELLSSFQKPLVRSEVSNLPYEQRHLLKNYGYRWAPTEKLWFKVMYSEEYYLHKSEIENLRKQYNFTQAVSKIPPDLKFSSTKNSFINYHTK